MDPPWGYLRPCLRPARHPAGLRDAAIGSPIDSLVDSVRADDRPGTGILHAGISFLPRLPRRHRGRLLQMKYLHSFHAGNFADVHKHVTLLALLTALKRKDKGFLYLETHAGRGSYDLESRTRATGNDARALIDRLLAVPWVAPELQAYADAVRTYRARTGKAAGYPGSPLIAIQALRPQDRAVLVELQPAEARALERAVSGHARVRVECGDGFQRLRAYLPPTERRGLLLIDPPFEETADFQRATAAVVEALQRFRSCVIAVWHPVKRERDAAAWRASFARAVQAEILACELWIHPRDSRVALNGSGMLIVNPPYLIEERMREWLKELHAQLDTEGTGGWYARMLTRVA